LSGTGWRWRVARVWSRRHPFTHDAARWWCGDLILAGDRLVDDLILAIIAGAIRANKLRYPIKDILLFSGLRSDVEDASGKKREEHHDADPEQHVPYDHKITSKRPALRRVSISLRGYQARSRCA
jgi:hypothetical protein